MKRLIKSIHSRAKDEKNHRCRHDAEPTKSGDVKVIIQWLKRRLEHILQLLHMMEKDKSSVSMNTTKIDHPAVDVPVTPSEAKSVTQNEKKVACKLVAALLDDNVDNLLSEGGRTVFACWMVKNIRPEAPSEEEEDGDVKEDRLYERRYQEKSSSKASRLIRQTRNPGEAPEHHADSEKPAAKARSTSSATEGLNPEAADDEEEGVAADEHVSSDNNADDSLDPSYFDTIFGTHNQFEGSIHIISHDYVKKCHNLDDNDATATKFRHEGSDDSCTSEVGEADEDIAD